MIVRTDIEQNSLEWLLARSGVVTASEMDNLLTPEFKPRTGEMVKTYLAQKLAEKWIGGPLPGFSTMDMEFGHILEEECLPRYELETDRKITRVAFVTSDDGSVGCSPDGLIGEDGGVEAKCPKAQTHVKYLLNGEVPKDYIVQVHAALFITGRKWWDFVSHHRRMPLLVVRVLRDEEICETIASVLEQFSKYMSDGMERLIEINGGPPKRPQPAKQGAPAFVSDPNYIIP